MSLGAGSTWLSANTWRNKERHKKRTLGEQTPTAWRTRGEQNKVKNTDVYLQCAQAQETVGDRGLAGGQDLG
jgi:hypothetical protein